MGERLGLGRVGGWAHGKLFPNGALACAPAVSVSGWGHPARRS